MFALFTCLAGAWTWQLIKSQKEHVQHIHFLMLALVAVKSLTVFGQAVMYYVIEHQGTPHGWNWVYYTFTGLRGLLFFTVVVLIGTGWSFMSAHVLFDERTKNVLLLVLPLQVIWETHTYVCTCTKNGNSSSSSSSLLLQQPGSWEAQLVHTQMWSLSDPYP